MHSGEDRLFSRLEAQTQQRGCQISGGDVMGGCWIAGAGSNVRAKKADWSEG
jgi:hypothetical protein